MDIKKVVIPVAGWGTRSLPATKNIPKEMLPVFRKPTVQHVIEEAMSAGMRDVVLVNNQHKKIIEDHFDHNPALENLLAQSGDKELLKSVQEVAELVNIITVRQKEALGLGHAVACARDIVNNEPFAVMVGDDLIFSKDPGIKQVIDVARTERMPVVGVLPVTKKKIGNYGIIDAEPFSSGLFRVRQVIEKPNPDDAPSNLAVVGRYVLTPDIFEYLHEAQPGHGNEVQLSDALDKLAKTKGLLAVRINGQRFDTGDWVDYLTANIYFALQDEELREELVMRLHELIPQRK